MSSPIKDTPPTFAEQQMLEKQRRYSQLLEDEGSDEIAQRLDAKVASLDTKLDSIHAAVAKLAEAPMADNQS